MLKALRGTKDILPSEIRIWQDIEASARDIFSIYGYKEIRTPVIEEASLFTRSIGECTDIVQKEMYVFSDRGGRNVALRPEATASVARSYIENSLGAKEGLVKLFYIGPMFRSERPQKGRQRQFHQLGIEAIGSDSPFLDIETILLAVDFLKKLNIDNFTLSINSLGCQKDKAAIIESHKNALKPYVKSLCAECQARYDKNVLRIFDCKNPECAAKIKNVKIERLLCGECSDHFDTVQKGLKDLGIKYTVDPRIVRGLDYYTKTVFEITQKGLGAKDAVCAGGRYNGLIKDIGGKDTPAVGFAFGIERLVMALKDVSGEYSSDKVFIAISDQKFYKEAFRMLHRLRRSGISCDIDYEDRSLKSQMRKAEKMKAKSVIIFGEEEFRRNSIALRDMESRKQKEVIINDVIKEIKNS